MASAGASAGAAPAPALEAPAPRGGRAVGAEAPSHAGARVRPAGVAAGARSVNTAPDPAWLRRRGRSRRGSAGMSPEAVNTRFVASSNAAAPGEATNGPLLKAAKLATKALSLRM